MWSTLRSLYDPFRDHVGLSYLRQFIDNHRGLAAATVGLLLYGAWFFRRPKNLPPGPYGYPIIGCYPLIEKAQKNQLREKYGDIVCLWLGHSR